MPTFRERNEMGWLIDRPIEDTNMQVIELLKAIENEIDLVKKYVFVIIEICSGQSADKAWETRFKL